MVWRSTRLHTTCSPRSIACSMRFVSAAVAACITMPAGARATSHLALLVGFVALCPAIARAEDGLPGIPAARTPDPVREEEQNAARPRGESDALRIDLAKVDRALFRIEAGGAMGSGFLYRTAGYVVTNRHVVDDVAVGATLNLRPVRTGADGAVTVGDPITGTLRFKHTELDVAVVQIAERSGDVRLAPAASVTSSHAPRGLELWAHGFPDVGSPTISRGMLSAHYQDPITGEILYLTDTALAPGSSGGPVTDAAGGVVGIATAVHIVEGGAGTSWGYVLPIRSVDKALSCASGFDALPKPFDVAARCSEIRLAASSLKAMQGYAEAVKEATARCASPRELADALLLLDTALAAGRGPLAREEYGEFIRHLIATSSAIDARFFEFDLLGETENALDDRRRYTAGSKLATDADVYFGRVLGDIGAEEGLVKFGHFVGEYATALMRLMESAEQACAEIKAAWDALEDERPAKRSDVRRYAKALSVMTQALNASKNLDPGQINADDPELPLQLRQSLRLSKATLQNLLDRWSEIPEQCRTLVEELNEDLNEDLESDAENAGAVAADIGADIDFDAFLGNWTDAGWTRWGGVQRATATGSGHGYTIDFDEAPALVYMVVHARGSRGFKLRVLDRFERALDLLDDRSDAGAFGAAAVEAPRDGKLEFAFDSKNLKDFPFEFAVLYRPTYLPRLREQVAVLGRYPEEIGPRTFFVGPREKCAFAFTADDWEAFLLIASDSKGRDIDLRILDPEGDVVASDEEADGLPIGEVERAVRGSYTLEIINATDRFASVDTLLVARKRRK